MQSMTTPKEVYAIALSVLSFILVVIAMAEVESHYRLRGGSCGLFTCEGLPVTNPGSDACESRAAQVKTAQAFSIMGCLGVAGGAIVHIVVTSTVPATAPRIFLMLRNLHCACAVALTLTWCLMCSIFSARLCDRRISDMPGATVGHGIFLLVVCTFFHIGCYVFCTGIASELEHGGTELPASLSSPVVRPAHR
ncbi:hypothetical protein DIPPA_03551 [Diplonema papillatum]|nr:hypothetical protein DIPPA_03551 [Diplonema papillatum]